MMKWILICVWQEGNTQHENSQLASKAIAIRLEQEPEKAPTDRSAAVQAKKAALQKAAQDGEMCLSDATLSEMKTGELHKELQMWSKVLKPNPNPNITLP